jgi:hypothetical protein
MSEKTEAETIHVFNASANPQAVDGAGVLPSYERAEADITDHNLALIESGLLQEYEPESEPAPEAPKKTSGENADKDNKKAGSGS